MTNSSRQAIKLKPLSKGIPGEKTFIASIDGSESMVLTADELEIIEELENNPLTVENFIHWRLVENRKLGLPGSLNLLRNLGAHGFLETERDFLRDITGENPIPISTWRFSLPLLSSPSFVQWKLPALLSTPAILFLLLVAVGGFFVSDWNILEPQSYFTGLFEHPFTIFLNAVIAVFVGSMVFSLWNATLLSAAGVTGSFHIELRLLLFPFVTVTDKQIYLAHKNSQIFFWLYRLAMPWIAFVAFWTWSQHADSDLVRVFAATSLGFTFAECNPFSDSALKGFWVSLTKETQIAKLAVDFLKRGLFAKDASSWAVTTYSSFAILWLYGVGWLTSHWLLLATAVLWSKLVNSSIPVENRIGALLFLVGLGLALLAVVAKVMHLLIENFMSATQIPLKNAKRFLSMKKRLSVDDRKSFLGAIPLFSDCDVKSLDKVANRMNEKHYAKKDLIFKKGDAGDKFFVITSGNAEIIIDNVKVAELGPGDCFGEIALLHDVPRTATVIAKSALNVLTLSRTDFETEILPDHEMWQDISERLRRTKQFATSQALSYLSPKEIWELSRLSHEATFRNGEAIVSAGNLGRDVYLITQGSARVIQKQKQVAILGAGDLVGFIAALDETPRTADVIAETETHCLRIDRATFLRVCTGNLLVALALSNLKDFIQSEAA